MENQQQIMEEYDDNDQVFSVIFNTKIQGQARNMLNINPPANWTNLLRHHYERNEFSNFVGLSFGNLNQKLLINNKKR